MLLQVHYLNKAMAEYGTGQARFLSCHSLHSHSDSAQVVPPYYCLFTGSAVMGSALLYKDLDNTSTQDMLVFCVSLLCVAIGVALVAKREGGSSDGAADNDMDRDQFDSVSFYVASNLWFYGVSMRTGCRRLTTRLQVPLLAPIDEPDADPRAAAKKTSMLVL